MALVFDIQRFCIHDGPGVRTTVFFKGCPLRCQWCQNPESQNPRAEMAFYAERCISCFSCRELCLEGAILTGREERVDHDRCTACGECAQVCPCDALRLVGGDWTPEQLMEEAARDLDFFQDSGGGLTLSGGEPLLHHLFLEDFLPLAKGENIHVTLETCGMAPYAAFQVILGWLDLIYFDLKIMDASLHKQYTGASNQVILGNFARLSREFPALQARMPVIPGVNDLQDNIDSTCVFLKMHGKNTIHLLPYHNLGQAKIGRIGTPVRPFEITAAPDAYLDRAREHFESEGINAIVYD